MNVNSARITQIRDCLEKAFQPSHLTIADESAQHVGHAGAKTGRGHFAIEIKADIFEGKNSVTQHRLIYAALGALMQTDIHAIRIKVL